MQLSMRTAVALFQGMSAVDSYEKTELDDIIRLRLAINLNLLKPYVEAYQKRRNAMVLDVTAGKLDPLTNAHIETGDSVLLDENVGDLPLKRFNTSELKLKDNKRITGQVIAMLAPLIKDFGDGIED